MASEEKFEELSASDRCKSEDNGTSSLSDDLPEKDQTYMKKLSNENAALNFNTGFATNFLDKIAHHQDLRKARERMKSVRKIVAAQMTDCQSLRIYQLAIT